MKLGMLWFDNDKTRTLAEKVKRAAAFYAEKYGVEPNCCGVGLGTTDGVEAVGDIALEESRYWHRYDLWMGVSDD